MKRVALNWVWTLVLVMLFFGTEREVYGQRVYANGQTSVTGLLGGTITNAPLAADSDPETFSELHVGVGVLNLMFTTQNLQFTGVGSPKPVNTSPIILKFSSTQSIANLIGGISIQRTNNGLNNTVGTEYTAATLLTLLNGSVDSEVIVPIPGITTASDGVRLRIATVLGLGVVAKLYSAFYIVPPQIPSTLAICENSSSSFSVSNYQSGYTYRLYTSEIGGAEVGTASTTATFNIPVNLPAAIYYLEAREADLYPSARTPIVITRNVLPAAPTAISNSTCSGATVSLSVVPVAGITYRWYTVATGGTAAFIGNVYNVEGATSTKTYYVESVNSTGCPSATRTPVTLTVNALPTDPVVPNVSACIGVSTTVSVLNPIDGTVYRWYMAPSGGVHFITGSTITISNPTTAITYYVDAINSSNCVSGGRTAVTVTIQPKPPAPHVEIQPNSQY